MSLNYDIVTASVFCIGTCKNGFQTPWSHKDPLSWGPDLDSSRLRTALSSPFSEPTNAPRTPRLSPRKSQWIQEIIVWSRVDYTVWTHSKETWSTLRKWEMHTNSKTAKSRTCRQVTHINLKTESKCHRVIDALFVGICGSFFLHIESLQGSQKPASCSGGRGHHCRFVALDFGIFWLKIFKCSDSRTKSVRSFGDSSTMHFVWMRHGNDFHAIF